MTGYIFQNRFRRPDLNATRGVSLVEVMVTAMIISVSVMAALQITATYGRSSMLAEQRRIAQQAAVAKVDQMRIIINNGVKLQGLYQLYGPYNYGDLGNLEDNVDDITGDLTTGSGNSLFGSTVTPELPDDPANMLPKCSALKHFAVGEDVNYDGILNPGEDLNNNDVLDYYLPRIDGRPHGTITFIDDESPEESAFGWIQGTQGPSGWNSGTAFETAKMAGAHWYERNPFGVDINGNGIIEDNANLSPFPMDLNNNGTTDDTNIFFDPNDTPGLILPIVITIQWEGPYGPERYDHFAILTEAQ